MPTEPSSPLNRRAKILCLGLGLALENPLLKGHRALKNEVWQAYCDIIHKLGKKGPVHDLVALPDIEQDRKEQALLCLADPEFNLEPTGPEDSTQFASRVVTWGVTPGFGCPDS